MERMKLKDFDYFLPKEFIAQKPANPRDHSKLMIYDSSADKVHHMRFYDIEEFLDKNDVLVTNSSKVIPARIIFHEGEKEREIFLLEKCSNDRYKVLVRPGKIFYKGAIFDISDKIEFEVEDIESDGIRVGIFNKKTDCDLGSELEKIGKPPFPPYINKNSVVPFERYQTVYANEKGSVAAPTAGLHFTEDLMFKLKNNGNVFEKIILHVGLGTFAPVKVDDISNHLMHEESFEISKSTAESLNESVKSNKRIVAVGTTSVRVLETNFSGGKFSPQISKTNIFIYPGYQWKIVDALITNFHLPKSTLLMLVSSFLEHKGVKNGTKKLLELYELAKQQNYRFYSFGDSMFIF